MNFSALMTVRSLYVILNRFSHLSRSFNSHIAVRLLSYVRSSDADWKSILAAAPNPEAGEEG